MDKNKLMLFLLEFYQRSKDHFGKLDWWPGDSKTEIIIGAILTQNTAWTNVEKALLNLKREGLIDFKRLMEIDEKYLSVLIKPAGYFNQKAKKLKKAALFFTKYSFVELESMKLTDLREKVISIWGVGNETADSILLYALNKKIFVIDAYTKRIFSRHGLWDQNIKYDDMQRIIMKNLPDDISLYNDFHAQIVEIGKNYCKKNNPLCKKCPIY